MKLFDDFEAVKFQEENMIFITENKYLKYIYNCNYKNWRMNKSREFYSISVENYKNVDINELKNSLGGIIPTKESDFIRRCSLSEWCIGDMLTILKEDYSTYMSDREIYWKTHDFLREVDMDICFKAYLELKSVFDDAMQERLNNKNVLDIIRKRSIDFLGRVIISPLKERVFTHIRVRYGRCEFGRFVVITSHGESISG